MKKLILAAVAAASLLAASAPSAFAGYTLCGVYGCTYVVTCGTVCGPYGCTYVCG